MSIEMVKIRATISVGSFSVETPFVLSFNVNKTRGQVSTFDASIKVLAGTTIITGSQVRVEAGSEGQEKLIFSGIIRKATLKPAFDDPQYVIIDIGGADVLSLLQGKKFTRRCKASRAAWVSIDGVNRKGLKSGKFKYKAQDILTLSDSDIEENVNLTSAMTMSDTTPFSGIDKASTDYKLKNPVVEVRYQQS